MFQQMPRIQKAHVKNKKEGRKTIANATNPREGRRRELTVGMGSLSTILLIAGLVVKWEKTIPAERKEVSSGRHHPFSRGGGCIGKKKEVGKAQVCVAMLGPLRLKVLRKSGKREHLLRSLGRRAGARVRGFLF